MLRVVYTDVSTFGVELCSGASLGHAVLFKSNGVGVAFAICLALFHSYLLSDT